MNSLTQFSRELVQKPWESTSATEFICNRTGYCTTFVEPLSATATMVASTILFGAGYYGISRIAVCLRKRYYIQMHKNDPLTSLAAHGLLGVIKNLSFEDIDLEACDLETKDTALTAAIRGGHFGTVKALLEAGADPKGVNRKGETPIYVACNERQIEIVKLLVGKGFGVNVNIRNPKGETPLMAAAKRGAASVVDVLGTVEGIEVNATLPNGQTALHLAAREHANTVRALLKIKANPDLQDRRGFIPLHVAADNTCIDTLPLLLEATEDVNKKDEEGNSPFHLLGLTIGMDLKKACAAAQAFLDCPAVDPNAQNDEGDSPLHIACNCISGKPDLALMMIRSKRFNLSLTNHEGDTPSSIARLLGVHGVEIVAELKESGKLSTLAPAKGTQIPSEAVFATGDPVGEKTIDELSNEELSTIKIGDFTLVEWAVLFDYPDMLKALGKKGVTFALTDENKEKLISAFFDEALSWLEWLAQYPVKIRELRLLKEDLQTLKKNPNAEPQEPVIIQLLREKFEAYLSRCARINAYENEKGAVFGWKLSLADQLDLRNSLRNYFELLFFISQIDPNNFYHDLLHLPPEQLINKIPKPLQGLLEREFSFEEFAGVLPDFFAVGRAGFVQDQIRIERGRKKARLLEAVDYAYERNRIDWQPSDRIKQIRAFVRSYYHQNNLFNFME